MKLNMCKRKLANERKKSKKCVQEHRLRIKKSSEYNTGNDSQFKQKYLLFALIHLKRKITWEFFIIIIARVQWMGLVECSKEFCPQQHYLGKHCMHSQFAQ